MKQSFIILCIACLFLSSANVHARKSGNEPTKSVEIQLNSHPTGASVYYKGQLICTSTPAIVKIPVEYKIARLGGIEVDPMVFTFVLDGYEMAEETISGEFIPVPYKVDYSEYGYRYKMRSIYSVDKNVMHFFKQGNDKNVHSKDPTIPQGAAEDRVTRDNPGESELERTIIRWYFDSAPRGARVFWRVISSIPAEVKNTNELYLGPTPFEETRSFNILGLTYANSRDVQIEIKVTKNGYMDQVKRFNVRQAIDQQEISSFFELVPTE